MREKLHKAIKWFLSALDTHSKGSSARKWSAFAIMVCVVMMHTAWIRYAFTHENFMLMEGILIIDYSFIAALLGMTTWEAMKKGKDKPNEDEQK